MYYVLLMLPDGSFQNFSPPGNPGKTFMENIARRRSEQAAAVTLLCTAGTRTIIMAFYCGRRIAAP